LTIGVLGFDSRRGLGIFLFTTASRTALGPTQPPIQWVPGAPSLGVKRLWREADHSPPSSAEVKNSWSYTSTPPIRLQGVVLSYAQGLLLLLLLHHHLTLFTIVNNKSLYSNRLQSHDHLHTKFSIANLHYLIKYNMNKTIVIGLEVYAIAKNTLRVLPGTPRLKLSVSIGR
jgi:hypothetical protein